ncbi:hypothetical protein [Thermosipho sp. (in: thermotogales)]|jgi:hypothetical protein|nr:hypothetical protein [Thermosipho sp. (in: thermotogales)]MBZ4649246.1 hypothetical protein [Thermosipho sp. (in: thermotogales)]
MVKKVIYEYDKDGKLVKVTEIVHKNSDCNKKCPIVENYKKGPMILK